MLFGLPGYEGNVQWLRVTETLNWVIHQWTLHLHSFLPNIHYELKQYLWLCDDFSLDRVQQTGATPVNSINIYCGMCCIPVAVTSFSSPQHALFFFSMEPCSCSHSHLYCATSLSRRFLAARLLCCCCCVPWFEFQNISDWLLILTTDDVMETLLSSALKNSRMIYNEMQPVSFFQESLGSAHDSGARAGFFFCSLNFWHLCFWEIKPSHYTPACPATSFLLSFRKLRDLHNKTLLESFLSVREEEEEKPLEHNSKPLRLCNWQVDIFNPVKSSVDVT